MRNLRRLLGILTGQRFINYLMAEANDLHARAVALAGWMIGVGIIGILFNIVGLKAVNFYLAMLVNILMIIIMTRPHVLLTIGAIGVVTDRSWKGGKDLLKKAADAYVHVLLYISIFFLFVGIFSLRNNPKGIGMIIAALLVTTLIDKAGWFKPIFYRRVIYVFANGVIIFGILSFIPRAGYIKVLTFYPYSFLTTTELEDKVSDVEEAEIKAAEKVATEKLEEIEEKIEDGQKLSEEDKNFWEQQKALRDGSTTSARIKSSIGGLFNSTTQPTTQIIAPRDTQMMTWIVTPTPQKLVRVYNGDKMRYISPKGFWVIGETGKKFYHNPSDTPGEIRSFPFYNQGPEGEIVFIKGDSEEQFELNFQITKS